jgi:peptidoglycan/LPS O-acetylase OafA/YrhL
VPTQPQPARTYIPGLDGIRAIAFLLVFWAHALPGISYYIPATLGVTIFFFLSGFLITTLLRRELTRTGTLNLRAFYIRRTLRIFVPLYLIYALAAAIAHFVFHWSVGNWLGFFSLLLYFYNYAVAFQWHAWLPPGLIVIWSLAVEEHFYLLFPCLLLWMTRRRLTVRTQTRLLVTFCLAELLWRAVLWQLLNIHTGWTYAATDARLDGILWGAILALRNNPLFNDPSILPQPCPPEGPHELCHPERSRGPRRAFFARWGASEGPASPKRHQDVALKGTGFSPSMKASRKKWGFSPGGIASLALLTLLLTLFIRNHLYRESLRYTLQALCLYVLFSYILPNIRRWPLAWLEWLPLRYIGWTSYVLYLSHDFILVVVNDQLPHRLWLTSTVAFAIALLFATLIRYTVELPLQRLRNRLTHA